MVSVQAGEDKTLKIVRGRDVRCLPRVWDVSGPLADSTSNLKHQAVSAAVMQTLT